MKKFITFLTAVMIMCMFSAAFAAERFVIPLDAENDLYTADKTFTVDGIEIAAAMSRPTAAFQPISFTFAFSEKGAPVAVENGKIKFNMKMDMGEYSYDLAKVDGKYTATAVLPKCMMGGEIWFGKLTFSHKGSERSKVFFFKIPNKKE
ncbi:hypothetical protein EP073_03400 [Geovibrio thiophilus]|uniref:YtkA-like domain-containing protein n=1 Tax=Geovibrio thiophilus TaxID=139438 RepID=A0A410JWS7_9BACT|nr:hypothetical protein [Geovibrio thiophilus]QAR32481.1 hypothetical protein EP073_03400 [Geovibrio thiophilus]